MTKNYTLFCHGSVNATATMEPQEYGEPYAQLNIPYATIPENVKIIFYIPPGTIFNATSGLHLFNHVSNSKPEEVTETDKFVSTMKGILKYKTKVPEREGETRMFLSWDTKIEDFPRVVSKNSNSWFAYDYNLKGKRQQDNGTPLDAVKWGLWESGLGASRAVHELPTENDKSTMTEVLASAAKDAGEDTAIVHAIFCRVEILTSDETDKTADQSGGAFPKSRNIQWTSMKVNK